MTVRPELPPALIGIQGQLPRVSYVLSDATAGRIHPIIRVRFAATSSRDSPALRRRSPATASPGAESIGRPGHYGRDPFFSFSRTTGPTRPVPRTRAEHDVTTVSRRCRAPLLRFSSPSAFAGHARVLMSGGAVLLDSSRFDLSSPPVRASRSHGPAGVTCVPAVFRFWRTRRDEARVADVRAGLWDRIRRARVLPVPAGASTRCRDFVGTWRRLDGLLPVAPYVFDRWSSGVTGETDRFDDRQPFEPARSEATHLIRACHARQRSDHSSAFATRPPGRFTSHSPNRVLLPRGVPLPVRPQRDLAGRRRSSLVRRPTTLMGFQIRALRRVHPTDGWSYSNFSAPRKRGG
jgi:hypothetical protein